MKYFRQVLAKIKEADTKFNLINNGDKIVVGISGGKDSIVLFEALHTYHHYAKKQFTLVPVILDLGFDAFDANTYVTHFKSRGYELLISDAKSVYKILEIQQVQQRLTKLPCSICSKMKKAAINKVANELGANKVAFAHHIDDALETMVMNMISGGRLATFQPKMHLERADITFIRPLILANETMISKTLHELNLPLLTYACPNNKKTRREDIKNLLRSVYDTYPSAEQNFELLLTNANEFNLWYEAFDEELLDHVRLVKVHTPAQMSKALYIRTKVFVEEKGISIDDEFDSNEREFTSYLLYVKDELAATIRYKIDKVARQAVISRIAVLPAFRRRNYAKLMIKYIEKELTFKYRPLTILIGGMVHLSVLYETLGYEKVGESYVDAGIDHYKFIKKIK